MSACGSPLSSNSRIEPAMAVKDSVRPGSSSVCLVLESGGRRCSSATDGAAGVVARPPPPFSACGLLLRGLLIVGAGTQDKGESDSEERGQDAEARLGETGSHVRCLLPGASCGPDRLLAQKRGRAHFTTA